MVQINSHFHFDLSSVHFSLLIKSTTNIPKNTKLSYLTKRPTNWKHLGEVLDNNLLILIIREKIIPKEKSEGDGKEFELLRTKPMLNGATQRLRRQQGA